MFKKICAVLLIACISFAIPGVSRGETTKLTKWDLLTYWAPQVYQDVRQDKVLGYQYYAAGDQITKVNFDGDWDAGNSWDRIRDEQDQYGVLPAYAYCSYLETETHHFLGYYYYHAMDDAVIEADRHENDVEYVYICVEKNNGYGNFVVMVTKRHRELYAYYENDVLFEKTDGNHPKIFISSNGDVINSTLDFGAHGHSIYAYDPAKHNCSKYIGGDAIIYNVGPEAQYPVNINGQYEHAYTYKLLDIDEIWQRRFDIDTTDAATTTFETPYGKLNGRDEPAGGIFPWEKVYFYDPAAYFNEHYNVQSGTEYIVNPFTEEQDFLFDKEFGGEGGCPFCHMTSIDLDSRLSAFTIWTGERVDGLELRYKDGTVLSNGDVCTEQTLSLQDNEYIQQVYVCKGRAKGSERIFYIEVTTNRGRSISGGTKTNNSKTFTAPEGYCIIGFLGRAGNELDRIGPIYQKMK